MGARSSHAHRRKDTASDATNTNNNAAGAGTVLAGFSLEKAFPIQASQCIGDDAWCGDLSIDGVGLCCEGMVWSVAAVALWVPSRGNRRRSEVAKPGGAAGAALHFYASPQCMRRTISPAFDPISLFITPHRDQAAVCATHHASAAPSGSATGSPALIAGSQPCRSRWAGR